MENSLHKSKHNFQPVSCHGVLWCHRHIKSRDAISLYFTCSTEMIQKLSPLICILLSRKPNSCIKVCVCRPSVCTWNRKILHSNLLDDNLVIFAATPPDPNCSLSDPAVDRHHNHTHTAQTQIIHPQPLSSQALCSSATKNNRSPPQLPGKMDSTVSQCLPPSFLVSYLPMSSLLWTHWLFSELLFWEASCTVRPCSSVCRSSTWQREIKSVCVQWVSVCVRVGLSVCALICAMRLFRQPTLPQLKQPTETSVSRWRHCKPHWPIPSTTKRAHIHTHSQWRPVLPGHTISHSPAMFISSDNFLGQTIVSLFIWTPGSNISSTMIQSSCSLL